MISDLTRTLYTGNLKIGILGIRDLPDQVTNLKIRAEIIGN